MKDLNRSKDKIIFALDVSDFREAEKLVKLLINHVGIFKVGSQLFAGSGPQVIEMIRDRGGRVFLDLKFHDIPNTVGKVSEEAVRFKVSMFSIHSLGGFEMMKQAVIKTKESSKNLGIPKPAILAVTVLTSLDQNSLKEIGIEHPLEEISIQLANLSRKAGVDGIITSPEEIGVIRKNCGKDFLIVTPGIRPSSIVGDDQKRFASPRQALSAGADFIVVGRPIREAKDPLEAAKRMIEEVMRGEDLPNDQ